MGRSHVARALAHAERQRSQRLAKSQRAVRRAVRKLVATCSSVLMLAAALWALSWFVGGAP